MAQADSAERNQARPQRFRSECGRGFRPTACIRPTPRLVECQRAHDIRILRLWEDGIGPGRGHVKSRLL